MPDRTAARLAVIAAIASLAVAPAALAVPAAPQGAATIHLDRERGDGYVRPQPVEAGCLAGALEERPAAAGVEARVTFTVLRDGAIAGLTIDPPVGPKAEAALRDAFQSCRWSPGLDPEGRPVVVQVTQPVLVHAGSDHRAPAGNPAVAPGRAPPPVAEGGAIVRLDGPQGTGFSRPVLREPACLPAALRRHRGAAGVDNKVRFAVLRDGSVTRFSFQNPERPEVEQAVVEAFEDCRWKPALDPSGEPLAVWVVQPVKVAPLPPPLPEPAKQQPLFP